MKCNRAASALAVFAAILAVGTTPAPAWATHLRYGHVTWVPRPDIHPNAVDFKVQNVWRRDAYGTGNGRCIDPLSLSATACTGTGGFAGVGDLIHEAQGNTRLDPGDNSGLIGGPGALSISLLYLVTAVDEVNNWAFGLAVDPADLPAVDTAITHVYPAPGNYTAVLDDCCRIEACEFPTAHMNNPEGPYRIATTVNVGSGNSSPVSSLPPIILCPIDGLCQFPIEASDNELDPLTFRLSTGAESNLAAQPGPPQCPSGATVMNMDADTGTYVWDTTGCRLAGDPPPIPPDGGCDDPSFHTCYSTQVTIEENPGTSDAALDFLICLVACPPGNTPPTFSAPTPGCGSTISTGPGIPVSFTVQASDAETDVSVNVINAPGGAVMSPGLPLSGNPVSSNFSWTPSIGDLGQHQVTFTAEDPCGTHLCSLTIDVSDENCFDGVDNDTDGLADCADPDCDGVPCDDGVVCTINDTCGGGTCQAGVPDTCDDSDPCTDDSCNPISGCVHSFNTAPCDDGLACTTNDTCAPDGSCKGGPPPDCFVASDDCNTRQCDPAGAEGNCDIVLPAPVGQACNDGDLCTIVGSCLPSGGGLTCQPVGPSIVVTGHSQVFKGGSINRSVLVDNDQGFIGLYRNTYMADGTMLSAHKIRSFRNVSLYNVTADVMAGHQPTIRCQDETNPAANCITTTPFVSPGAYHFCSLPSMPVCGGAAVTVLPDATQTLTPGTYGNIKIGGRAVLQLEAGTYDICSLRAAPEASLVVIPGATGAEEPVLRINRFLRAQRSFTLTTASGIARPTIYVGDKFAVARDANVKAHIMAPNGIVRFFKDASFDGTICTVKLLLFRNSVFDCIQ